MKTTQAFSRLPVRQSATTTVLQLIAVWGFLFTSVTTRIHAAAATHHELATWYSPVILQELVCTEYGDYITRIDYDGDYIGNNNWNNLGYPDKARPLPAYVYTAVIETATHYFIWYALFHPADDFNCHFVSHENDLEGLVMTVHKDGTVYGHLRMVQLQAHWDFYQYRPPDETGITNKADNIDGTIELDYTYPGVHPIVYVEGGGHGLRNQITGTPVVCYYYTGTAQDPDVAGRGLCGYDLLSISAEMWERRTDCCGAGHLFDDWGDYVRKGFSVYGLGRKFDGDDGGDDGASPPWNWNDDDDGDDWLNGDWFMHPAGYHGERFDWAENFATDYIFHPFGLAHLGDDIYNGANGTTTLWNGPYYVVRDLRVLSGQHLVVGSGRTVQVSSGVRLVANGSLEADGRAEAVRLVRSENPNVGIVVQGQIRMQNGGSLKY